MRNRQMLKGLMCGVLSAGICMGMAAVGSFPVHGAQISHSASKEYDAIMKSLGKTETSSSGSSRSKSEQDKIDEKTGPGVTKVEIVEDSGNSNTPAVKEVSLSETYHEDYEVYEQNMEDVYFLYTTVENGGITDKSVALDIPAGLSYTMEKDGVETTYLSGQAVSERGTYVFRFTAVDDPSLPFSEQTIYKAVFRFRIQEKVEKEEESPEEESNLPASAMGLNDSVKEADGELEDETSEEDAAKEDTQETDASGEKKESNVYISDSGVYNEDAIDAMIENVIGTGATDESNVEGYVPANGLGQVYDDSRGLYCQTLLTGSSFYTNVPNGMIIDQEVNIQSPSEGLVLRVYKDGEEIEYTPGTAISEAGSYLVTAEESSTLFISGYNGKDKPVFQFRILNGPVNDLGVFHAPVGMTITSVTQEGRELPEMIKEGGRYASLWEDGTFQITLSGEQGDVVVPMELDRVYPRFYVSTEKNRAIVSWSSSDVARCVLYKNGEPVQTDGIIYEVEGSGKYQLQAYDHAGNVSNASFEVEFALNQGAVIAILIAVVLVGGGIFFAVNVNKRLRVR